MGTEGDIFVVFKSKKETSKLVVWSCETQERDAFDALFDNAPEKLNVVKKFHDGVYLIFLLGLLEGFFVPLYQFYITPSNKDEKLHNVALAIDLMRDSGMKFYAKPEVLISQRQVGPSKYHDETLK